ncbi:MAG: glycerate kinase [Halobacteriaceae archaeon]
MTVSNRSALLERGQTALREVALDVADGALAAMHPDALVPAHLALDGDVLRADGRTYDLSAVDRVLLLAAGKGSLALASAVREVLGDRIDAGVVVEKAGQGGDLADWPVHEAGHPLPDEGSVAAADAVLAVADDAGPDDLVVACVTGGASALIAAPAGDLRLADLRTTTDLLLRAGAPIQDVNAVRTHLSRLKGGRLADRIAPARCLTLVVVDEVGGAPWGPTVPDEATFDDAWAALDRHGLLDAVPDRVRAHLARGRSTPATETPGPGTFDAPAEAVVLADAPALCDAAAAAAADRGYDAHVLSASVEGESREVARAFGAVARECADRGRPFEAPAVLVSGGETTVTLGGEAGAGGPNQEFALAFAREIPDREVCTVAVGTDGTDGPTDLAGGVADGTTLSRAAEAGVDVDRALREHDAATALRDLGDAVVTGPTGTNVMDLRVTVLR